VYIAFTFTAGNRQKIIYNNLLGGPGVILTSNIDGTDQEALPSIFATGTELDSNPPAISPDGKKVFFNAITPQNKEDGVYAFTVADGTLSRILTFVPTVTGFNLGQAF
jgi:hypothetical protein